MNQEGGNKGMLSYEAKRTLLEAFLNDKLDDDDDGFIWVSDLDDVYVYFNYKGNYYSAPYTFSQDGEGNNVVIVNLEEKKVVVRSWQVFVANDSDSKEPENKETEACGDKTTESCGDKSTCACDNKETEACGDKSTEACDNKSTESCGDKSTCACGDKSTESCGDKSTCSSDEDDENDDNKDNDMNDKEIDSKSTCACGDKATCSSDTFSKNEREFVMIGKDKVFIDGLFEKFNFLNNQFNELNEKLFNSTYRAHMYANVLMPISNNISHIFYAIIAIVGGLFAINNLMTLGSLVTFLQFTRNFANPIAQISQQLNTMLAALAGAERIFEIMDQKSEVDNGKVRLVNVKKENRKLVEVKKNTGTYAWKVDNKLVLVEGKIEFNNVIFGYNSDKIVLKDISLYAKPGQKIAFVGSTGAGKTTITNLLNRFYDIKEGSILYDGIDIREINKKDLRKSLSMVLQDTHLFTGTIYDNIRYGRLNATDEEVIEAAKKANADSFIDNLPDGYNTVLNSDGANLSQGQRQLLSIARAAVANPIVLVLDEATSSIDTRTELLIENGMNKLMKNKTTFVIAHRLSTVKNANAIMVLENGKIIERGDHLDLLEQKGRYYELYTGMFELE